TADPASVTDATEQVAGSADGALDEEQPDQFLAEGGGRAQPEQHRVVDATSSVVVLDERAVSHDVVAVGVARRIHMADAHVPLTDLASATQDELVDDHRGGLT